MRSRAGARTCVELRVRRSGVGRRATARPNGRLQSVSGGRRRVAIDALARDRSDESSGAILAPGRCEGKRESYKLGEHAAKRVRPPSRRTQRRRSARDPAEGRAEEDHVVLDRALLLGRDRPDDQRVVARRGVDSEADPLGVLSDLDDLEVGQRGDQLVDAALLAQDLDRRPGGQRRRALVAELDLEHQLGVGAAVLADRGLHPQVRRRRAVRRREVARAVVVVLYPVGGRRRRDRAIVVDVCDKPYG